MEPTMGGDGENSEIEDFTKRTTNVKGPKMGIFWDVKACPFPEGFNPGLMYRDIEKVLFEEFGIKAEMSIWASWDEFLRKKSWESSIFFLPRGDFCKKRMAHDIYLWKLDSSVEKPYNPILVIVSKEVKADKFVFEKLQLMDRWYYHVFLVDPAVEVSPDCSDWPRALLEHLERVDKF